MKRVLILVEGQTEEQFVKEVLRPHLQTCGVFVTPTIVATKRMKQGANFKGGVLSFNQVRRDILLMAKDTNAVRITTMIDFYGLPDDFPGSRRAMGSAIERVKAIQEEVNRRIGDPRFKCYLMLHEFEAMLFSHPRRLVDLMGKPQSLADLESIVEAFDTPESINDDPQTAPSKRLKYLFPGFQKVLYGPLAALEITLPTIREQCPHFNEWLVDLENLANL